ncbi:MAG: molecular chaperone TorD family protein [Eggerthellaceae bacterium]|nr:molecular chaperone TorD family protein [Eggerthellaceae bacterium]MDR2715989.1 molecular chaperone TorD family protein [Coriobacteriaceae bacterium]
MDDQRTQFLEGTAIALAVFGILLYEEPSAERLGSLAGEGFFSEMPLAGATPRIDEGIGLLEEWAAQAGAKAPQETAAGLSAEWFRLFVGAGEPAAPPWASYYLERDPVLFSKSTLGVRQHYAAHGLELERKYHEPDDHLGLMLQFLSVVAAKENEALCAGAGEGAAALKDERQGFVSTYILPWVGTWQQRVDASSTGPFYRGLAILVSEMVALIAADAEMP